MFHVSVTRRIACVSAPSVYQKLKQGVVDGSDRVSSVVLEYDRRFAAYGDDFLFYDYNEPLSFAASVAPQSFDIVLADPPYLSEECLSKVAETIKYLSKGKVLLCTGEREEGLSLHRSGFVNPDPYLCGQISSNLKINEPIAAQRAPCFQSLMFVYT